MVRSGASYRTIQPNVSLTKISQYMCSAFSIASARELSIPYRPHTHNSSLLLFSISLCPSPCTTSSCTLPSLTASTADAPSFSLTLLATPAISSSYTFHSGTCLLARSNLGSFVSGLLHRSIVLATPRLSSLHHVSHHSHSCGRLWMGN